MTGVRLMALLVLVFALAGCGQTSPLPAASVQDVSTPRAAAPRPVPPTAAPGRYIVPSAPRLEPGEQARFGLFGPDGREVPGPVVWTVESSPVTGNIGTITDEGVFTASEIRGSGGFVIGAAGGETARTSVLVRRLEPVALEIVGPPSVLPGATVRLMAIVRDQRGAPTCRAVTWAVTPPTAGSIQEFERFGNSALFRAGRSVGSALISAVTIGGTRDQQAATGSLLIRIDPTTPLDPLILPRADPSIQIKPTKVTIDVGRMARFSAVIQKPGTLGGTGLVSFAVCPESLGQINQDGLFIAARSGAGYVAATMQPDGAPAQVAIASVDVR